TLAPIRVACNQLEYTLLNQGLDVIQCLYNRSSVCSDAVSLGEWRKYLLSGGADAERSQFDKIQNPQTQRVLAEIAAASVEKIVLSAVGQGRALYVGAVRLANGEDKSHTSVGNGQGSLSTAVSIEGAWRYETHDAVVQQATVKGKTSRGLQHTSLVPVLVGVWTRGWITGLADGPVPSRICWSPNSLQDIGWVDSISEIEPVIKVKGRWVGLLPLISSPWYWVESQYDESQQNQGNACCDCAALVMFVHVAASFLIN